MKIINNTFKKIKSTKEDQETKNKVSAFKEEQKARKDLAKLQLKVRNEYGFSNTVPIIMDEFNTRVVTPMFTLPRHPNDCKLQTM